MATPEEKFLAHLQGSGQEPAVQDSDNPDDESHLETGGTDRVLPEVEQEEQALEARPGPEQDRPFAPISSRNLFVHHDTHPVVFDLKMFDKYQTDWFEWEPDTMWREILEDFHVPSISDHAKAKIQAVRTLHINDWFWTKWEVFCWLTQALNNNIPDWQVIQKPSVAQMMNAVEITSMVRNDVEFGLEVQGFMAAAAADEGVTFVPKPIQFCQDELEHLMLDRKIDIGALNKQIQEKYEHVIRLPDSAWTEPGREILGENVVDVQVAKLKVAWDYLSLRRRQLNEQLHILQ